MRDCSPHYRALSPKRFTFVVSLPHPALPCPVGAKGNLFPGAWLQVSCAACGQHLRPGEHRPGPSQRCWRLPGAPAISFFPRLQLSTV